MLQLIASGPGTGKTSACIELFRNEIARTKSGIDSRSFFVLPSREHAERIQHLILKKDVPGLFNAHILTLNELAARLSGFSAAAGPSDALRRRLIGDILASDAGFPYFEKAKAFTGFHELMSDLIREFESSCLTIEDFETLAQPLVKDPVFRSKFRDFSVLYKNYCLRLAELGLQEPEAVIRTLAGKQKGPAAAEKLELVVFDGFYHFSRAQQELIRVVSRSARHAVVTLTLPSRKNERPDLFYHAERTRAFLERTGFKASARSAGENRRSASPVLRHVLDELFSAKPKLSAVVPGALAVLEAPDRRGEIEMIAREIRSLVRQDAYYLSDIAVILRSVSPYQTIIQSVFDEFNIPVHVHERTLLTDTRLGAHFYRLVRFMLGSSAEEDLAVLTASTLAPDAAAQRERLEALRSEVLSCAGAVPFCRAFRQYLSALEPDGGAAERQAARTIEDILRSIESYYARGSKRTFAVKARLAELETVAGSALFSLKGHGKNRVQVYDAVMALPKEYKAVFIAGLVEKEFPVMIQEDPVFKDAERAVLNRSGVVLEERHTRAAGERYFFYMAAARAREKLTLSYPLYDAQMRPVLPSFFVEEVRRLFHKEIPTRTRRPDALLPAPAEWETEADIMRAYGQSLRGAGANARRLAALAAARGVPAERLAALERCASRSETDAAIRDERIAARFASLDAPFSPSRLEKLAACKFRYFAGEFLKLNEPLEGREAMQMGTTLHKTLELYYGSLDKESLANGQYLENGAAMLKKLKALLGPAAEKYLTAPGPRYRRLAQMAQMETALELFILTERKLREARGFTPSHFELTFSDRKPAPLGVLELGSGADKIRVRGQIDRIDVTADGKQALVIDYKLSKRPLSKKIEKGLELQLPLYVLVARKLLKLEVLGAEHRYLSDGERAGFYRKEARKTLALHGSVKSFEEPAFEAVLENAERSILELVASLKKADISVKSRSCEFCHFSPVCRFETWKIAYE